MLAYGAVYHSANDKLHKLFFGTIRDDSSIAVNRLPPPPSPPAPLGCGVVIRDSGSLANARGEKPPASRPEQEEGPRTS